jgi:hypothetical protein
MRGVGLLEVKTRLDILLGRTGARFLACGVHVGCLVLPRSLLE